MSTEPQEVSTAQISAWLSRGRDLGATHVVVSRDTFSGECAPTYVMPGEDAAEVASHPGEMEKTLEVYDLSMDTASQLKEWRSFHV
jgi:hypothetical protein